MFSWIPIHQETIQRVLAYREDQKELLTVLQEMKQQGLTIISLHDKDKKNGNKIPLAEIDPLTFLASFNRGVTEKNRRNNWAFLKKRWDLHTKVPDDFTGLPIFNNMSSWLFPYSYERESDHVNCLWEIASQTVSGTIDNVKEKLFDRCLTLKNIGIGALTIGMFWINPEKHLPADSKTIAYGKSKGIETDPTDYQSYRKWIKKMTEGQEMSYPTVSHEAHLFAIQGPPIDPNVAAHQYWLYAPGKNAKFWEEFYEKGIMAIGGDFLGDLKPYASQEEILDKTNKDYGDGGSHTNDALCYWEFSHEMKLGDIVFSKKGRKSLIGVGQVASDYSFDASRNEYKHIRKVTWFAKGAWDRPEGTKFTVKALTDITPYPEVVEALSAQVDLNKLLKDGPVSVNYWWLNTNPKIWDITTKPIGTREVYTSHNENGNKRRIYQYFTEVKAGDLIWGYVSSPVKQIVALCKVTKGLGKSKDDSECFEFEKIREFKDSVSLKELQSTTGLSNAEPLKNNQGSLFKLTQDEFDIITNILDERNVPVPPVTPYTKEEALAGLFMSETCFDNTIELLKYKKNIVLQGPPGVGKTFVAQRLANSLLQAVDKTRVQTIQFHQSYAYEDFIQGIRPNDQGRFEITDGIFYRFCAKARLDPGKKYCFVIDEINRGNLSKVFGEVMMLIEADKRGEEILLANSRNADETFTIPDNVYLIGTMNTADRSLAMVDYALRRRFCFIELEPAFSSPEGIDKFRTYLVGKGTDKVLVDMIVKKLSSINAIITKDTKNLGSGYCLGHSYFCTANGKYDRHWFERIIRFELKPLLQEYWFDAPEDVEKHVEALLGDL